jgi:hypothetical protein
VEGGVSDILKMTQQYIPYVKFEVHPVAFVKEIEEMLKHVSG